MKGSIRFCREARERAFPFAQWDERLDALLAGAMMSLQAVKAVEIGTGIHAAHSAGQIQLPRHLRRQLTHLNGT